MIDINEDDINEDEVTKLHVFRYILIERTMHI